MYRKDRDLSLGSFSAALSPCFWDWLATSFPRNHSQRPGTLDSRPGVGVDNLGQWGTFHFVAVVVSRLLQIAEGFELFSGFGIDLGRLTRCGSSTESRRQLGLEPAPSDGGLG